MVQTANAFPYQSFIPYYINGLQISNDTTLPNTVINVSSGTTMDSTETFQIGLTTTASASTQFNGLGGLDTGIVAVNTFYTIFLVADPVSHNPTGIMLSTSETAPLMPFGYSAYKIIGFCATDSSAHILKCYWTAGASAFRLCMYDFAQQVLSNGNQTSFTPILLGKLVPSFPNTPVWISSNFAVGTAGDILNYQTFGGGASLISINNSSTTIPIAATSYLMANLNGGGVATINYKVSSNTDSASVFVIGYNFIL